MGAGDASATAVTTVRFCVQRSARGHDCPSSKVDGVVCLNSKGRQWTPDEATRSLGCVVGVPRHCRHPQTTTVPALMHWNPARSACLLAFIQMQNSLRGAHLHVRKLHGAGADGRCEGRGQRLRQLRPRHAQHVHAGRVEARRTRRRDDRRRVSLCHLQIDTQQSLAGEV